MALSDIKTIAYSKGLKYALPIHEKILKTDIEKIIHSLLFFIIIMQLDLCACVIAHKSNLYIIKILSVIKEKPAKLMLQQDSKR